MTAILRSDAYHISDDWPLRPQFNLWPRQRHGAVLWILAFFVYFRVQHADQPTLLDYADFTRRARWKAHSLQQHLQRVENYLSVLKESSLLPAQCATLTPRGGWPDAPTITESL